MIKICILDYGSGNIGSLYNLLKFLNYSCVVSNSSEDIKNSTHIILPGVGAFGSAMEKISQTIPLKILEREVLTNNKPFLGICVGMQVLADKSEEFGDFKGLGWVSGEVQKIDSKILPHIGWNEVKIKKSNILFKSFNEDKDFYFVNSFHLNVKDKSFIVAETEYGHNFCSVLNKGNIFGTQFHPEKSQKAGQNLLKNFLSFSC
ncbi:imidazole glycerol phosphate synthase subunit HisH [Pelagibacteraceae bacterium]|nr:imidazole glycerol phosphate synthase subunit HisH [Pelagibacteraceae bacterium]